MSFRMVRSLIAGCILSAGAALCATITLTGNAPTRLNVAGPCNGPGGPWPGCGIQSYLSYSDTQTINDLFTDLGSFNSQPVGEESFATAYANWSASNPGWTLNEQPGLANLAYNITTFDTFANQSIGFVRIAISVTAEAGYAGPALNQLVWIQGLEINYNVAPPPGSPADPPLNTLDAYSYNTGGTPSGGGGAFANPCVAIPASPNNATPSTIPATPANSAYCDPIYPFQDGNAGFFDRPTGVYPSDSFRGMAFLATVNTQTKTITLYDGGVNYGFDLFVAPEPSSMVLMGAGIGVLIFFRKRVAAACK
jgi:hypothetical protein